MKRKLSLLLAALTAAAMLTSCVSKPAAPAASSAPAGSQPTSSEAAPVTPSQSAPAADPASQALPRVMVLSGPTGVGAARLMADEEENPAVAESFTVVNDNQEVTNALVSGDADIAAIATNVAANLCSKTGGGIQVLCVNTLGVLYILEKGDTVRSMADLAGKTVYATGQGANPEFILNHLLTASDVDPSQVDVQWMTAQEVTARMASQESGICMLPVPAATALLIQDSGVREALSLSQVWDTVSDGSLAMGCLVARTGFIEENPDSVAAFLERYGQSIAFMSDAANAESAAELVARYGITPNAKVAQKAIPQCNLAFLTGSEMQDILQSYYGVLFRADPSSIGGEIPYDSFFYGVS